MYRSHNCGELRISNLEQEVSLSGWVQKVRDKGFFIWIDLRDRYGITQLILDKERSSNEIFNLGKTIGREYVIHVKGSVIERSSKNPKIKTGEIEVLVSELVILNSSKTPPFTIEDQTDGGEELRMKYRYLDIRRPTLKNNLILRHKISQEVRKYLSDKMFLEIETPYLIKSTPEGARDFVVPSRMNGGEFYALPQSPQTFKQLLMVAGLDKYFQIVKCFRDEDLRADRQPEFTQIDCEMSFVKQDDVLNSFEGLIKHLFSSIKNINLDKFPRMSYDEAVKNYGTDKPDLRYEMKFVELNDVTQHKDFNIFNSAELVVGFVVKSGNSFSRKDLDKYTDWVKRPQIGATGLVYMRVLDDGSYKSSVDKFYDESDLKQWANISDAKAGDILFILCGDSENVRKQLGSLRVHVADNLNLKDPEQFTPLWVVDFPLLEWDEESNSYHAMHHPFTSPKSEHIELIDSDPSAVRADAYDLVLNGNEIGGGSIRIHDKKIQQKMFDCLGFSKEEAEKQFGFLMNAFEYGAPPHGGIAFGLDRIVALMGGQEIIRDFIAFPKNNSGRDIMIDSPSTISDEQMKELQLKSTKK
ncbi:MAG: aspartate--tRNA ligase [Bacteroidetes bacterium MED-G13]|nr:MAG: aspartate--tRNA ligase [Bacteroidetes bacterium MED-G13]|tara:strand:- start:1149 stop:2900 length:1752 start_codon:yes stop_codon:yes gene_type:complete